MAGEMATRQVGVRFHPPNAHGFQHGEIVGLVPPEWHRSGGSYIILAPELVPGEGRRIKGWGHNIERWAWDMNGEVVKLTLQDKEKEGHGGRPSQYRYEVAPGEDVIKTILANQPRGPMAPKTSGEPDDEDGPVLVKEIPNQPVEEIQAAIDRQSRLEWDRKQLEVRAAKERAKNIEETGFDPHSPAAIAERMERLEAGVRRQKERERARAKQRSRSQSDRIARALDRIGDVEPIDACVETVFRPDERDPKHLKWIGDVSAWPEWMDAREVKVSPPTTGGGGHGLDLHAPGLRYDRAPMLRVNGVWVWFVPLGSRPGHHMGVCDTVDLPEIRGYGEDLEAADIEMPNHPIPPRAQVSVRKMHLLLQDPRDRYGPGMDAAMYRPWMADVRAIERAVMGISSAQGQVDIYCEMDERDLSAALRMRDCIDCRYRRRPPAYKDYSLDEWMEELNDPKLNGWKNRIEVCKKAARQSGTRADSIRHSIEKLRAQYDAAIGRCVEREEEYADLIQVLYPA